MTRATADNNTRRRDFLALTAAVATAVMATRPALASQPDDSALLALEEKFFEQQELAQSLQPEINRLSDIWLSESERLYNEALSREFDAGTYLTPEERWDLVTTASECVEHNRLCKQQDVHYANMGDIVREMRACPRTPLKAAGPGPGGASACCLVPGERSMRAPIAESVRSGNF